MSPPCAVVHVLFFRLVRAIVPTGTRCCVASLQGDSDDDPKLADSFTLDFKPFAHFGSPGGTKPTFFPICMAPSLVLRPRHNFCPVPVTSLETTKDAAKSDRLLMLRVGGWTPESYTQRSRSPVPRL